MTYIYETLNTNQIAMALYNDEYASWHKNYDACHALAEYLEELAEQMGEPIELDIVAIRCEYSLIKDINEYNSMYDTNYSHEDEVLDDTIFIHIDGESFIIEDY